MAFCCMFDFKQNTDLHFSFCSAIIFGKLTLFQSTAKVVFSDIIVVSYGKSANNNDDSDGDDDAHPTGRKPSSQSSSCPTIKFRIVNELHSHRRGAIVDARLKAVATIDAKNCILDRVQGQLVYSGALKDSARSHSTSMKAIGTILSTASHNARKLSSGIKDAISPRQQLRLSNLAQFRASSQYFSPQSLEIQHTTSSQSENMENSAIMTEKDGGDNKMVELCDDIMVQDETYVDKPNLVFTKIHFTPSKHPFFGSSWNVSHR